MMSFVIDRGVCRVYVCMNNEFIYRLKIYILIYYGLNIGLFKIINDVI